MRVTGLENACPRCGKKFDRYVKFECPFCGELILVGSQKCPVCKVDLPGISDQVKSKPVEKTMDELLDDLIEIESAQVKKEGRRFCCPKCSWLLYGTETKCPKCSQILTGKFGLQCPICGTAVEKGMRECTKCGIALEKVAQEAKPMVPFVPRPAEKSAVELGVEELAATRACPVCGTVSSKSLQKCPKCSTSFVETIPKAKPAEPVREPTKAQHADDALLALSEIEKQAQQPFRERKLKLKPEKVTTVDLKAQTGARGLSNGIGQVNGRSKTNGMGMVNGRSKINGTSMVNGRSRTNGIGVVNGRSLVNGTGISNGLRARARESAAKRTMFLTRWQFLAVLVAIAVVLPTFVILSYSKKSDQFAVDGEFDEWDDATTYGTRIQSTSSRTNITEWAVGSQSTDLFFYFRTQSHMMSSPEAESFYLFVDSDGSNTTGYIMESIGADYMLQLTGWDSTVSSTSISEYPSSPDQYDWNAWTSLGSFTYSTDGVRLEAEAGMPVALAKSAKFMLISKDSQERSSVSYAAPLKGGLLVVEQMPSNDVAASGIVPRSSSVAMLSVRFTCEGEGGHVDQIDPVIAGAGQSYQIASFSLDEGEEHEISVSVDTSSATDGQLVSAKILASSIVSSFATVEIIGDGASAYVSSSPPAIVIDGAFADWEGRLSIDQDSMSVTNPGVDIDEVGNVSTTDNSYFYVSVEGQMCSGTFVPAMILKPSGSGGGGGIVIPTRKTAEDILRIYIDSDRSNSTGEGVVLSSQHIGADQMIEVRGLFGRIVSMNEFSYSSGSWAPMSETVEAAKDAKRIEVSVSASSLGGSSDIEFIIETTTWKGRADLATYDPAAGRALTRGWVVDSTTTSTSATAMSYQRKLFYDGANVWSFYYDGSNTVCRYSNDGGATWAFPSTGTRPFTNNGVTNASIWYDSAVSTIYAVGDPNTSSTAVYVRKGVVDSSSRIITWSGASDSTITASANPLLGKNTFICKDTTGYLWVLSSMKNGTGEVYDLAAFRSNSVNSTSPWTDTGHMVNTTYSLPNAKGSILPAGSGSQVWAVYGYGGIVASRKYDGSVWLGEEAVSVVGTRTDNTDTAPPCALVDDAGVVHVVFGDGSKKGPQPYHAARNGTGWSTLHSLYIPTAQESCIYPTISLDKPTGRLYAFWILDDGGNPTRHWTVTGKYNTTSTWESWGTTPIYTSTDTTSPKQYLNSIYSAPGAQLVCFQWTQNTTAPDIEVIFDKIPEFKDIVLPVLSIVVLVVVGERAQSRKRNRSRVKDEQDPSPPPGKAR